MEAPRTVNDGIFAKAGTDKGCTANCVVDAMIGPYRDLDPQSLVRPGPAKGPSTVSPFAAVRSR